MYVIDTNVISELSKPNPAESVIKWVADAQNDCYLTAITLKELSYGMMLMDDGKRKNALRETIDSITREYEDKTLPFDASCSQICAKLEIQAIRTGHTPTIEDMMIAAICERHNAILVTRNTKDFHYLGINLINPFTEQTG
ncbi:MAG: type II toxin-antitoxin system VapC family toxin [Coriobacteriales bacterium]|jgi:predicted nucleic acid-binding protein|nr:type II toxin-antitoxin system VapC family toxin [Coriobacteriales bacterium]